MDDLDVAADCVTFVVPRSYYYHAVFYEYIAVPTLGRITVSDTQDLWTSCWLPACNVYQYEQLLPEIYDALHITLYCRSLQPALGPGLYELATDLVVSAYSLE